MDLSDGYRIFNPTAAQHTSFSAVLVTLCTIEHILGHKSSLSKYKK
jgi:hypothetical protein